MNNLSDDQLALFGCGAAFLISATLMSLSYALRPKRRHTSSDSPVKQDKVLNISQPAKAAGPTKRQAA